MFELIFDPNKVGQERFEICWQAVMLTNKPVTRDNEDDFISLMKKLKSISSEDKGNVVGGVTLRDLNPEGGTIYLERSEKKLLLENCIRSDIWRPVILEKKKETEEWIAVLKEVAGSTAKDARPEEKRRAVSLMENESVESTSTDRD